MNITSNAPVEIVGSQRPSDEYYNYIKEKNRKSKVKAKFSIFPDEPASLLKPILYIGGAVAAYALFS